MIFRSLADDVKKELDKYDKLPPPCVTTDVLVPSGVVNDAVWMVLGGQEWWREHRKDFPKLILVVREVMMVPASTARLERSVIKQKFLFQVLSCSLFFDPGLFSAAGRIVHRGRPRMLSRRAAKCPCCLRIDPV